MFINSLIISSIIIITLVSIVTMPMSDEAIIGGQEPKEQNLLIIRFMIIMIHKMEQKVDITCEVN